MTVDALIFFSWVLALVVLATLGWLILHYLKIL